MSEPLRIGVDARELLGDTTGVGRYLGELMRRWARQAGRRRHGDSSCTRPKLLPLRLPAGRHASSGS